MKKTMMVATGVLAAVLLAGCAGMFPHPSQRHDRSSSLVEFLYPDGAVPKQEAMPVLNLPLTIGVAFLPSATGRNAMLDEADKNRILQRVRERFESRRFVREIVPIPDYYLRGRGGFDGLAALQRLYNLDLVALVSHDQVARQQGNELSLTYLTIVGAYLFPGTSQHVNSMLDLAVVHPASGSLVLRAAGMDSREGVSTDVGAAGRLRERSVQSLHAAADQMLDNFDTELQRFEARVRDGTARVQIANPGGAGSFDWLALGLLVGALAFRTAHHRWNSGAS